MMKLKFTLSKISKLFVAAAALTGVAMTPSIADYPEKPITMVIGFKAGGGTDLTGRALAAALQEELGAQIAVVNQPGAASMIAAANVAKARPDGYTLWYGSIGTMILKNKLGQSELDPMDNFVQLGTATRLVPAIAVSADSKYQTIHELLADAKARPGELRWGHGGAGSAFMASGVGFIEGNGLDVVAVPFSGTAKARQGMIAGTVDFYIENMNIEMKMKDKIRILGVMRGSKSDLIDQNVPALGDEGVSFIAIDSPVGLLAPLGTPKETADKLAAALVKAANSPAYAEAMAKLKFPVAPVSQADGSDQIVTIRTNVEKILPGLGG